MDLASIIALVSQHNADPSTASETVESEIVETVIGRNLPKPQRGSKSHAKGEVAAPIHDKPAVFGVTMPERNTLDAKSFLLTVRKAKDRNEVIQAIHAYCGYNPSGNFGTQDAEARAKAQREIAGFKATGPSLAEKRAAARSVAGFTAGMPQPSQKLLANLKAREQAAVEAMIDAKTDQDRATHAEVLKQIRAAIDALV